MLVICGDCCRCSLVSSPENLLIRFIDDLPIGGRHRSLLLLDWAIFGGGEERDADNETDCFVVVLPPSSVFKSSIVIEDELVEPAIVGVEEKI